MAKLILSMDGLVLKEIRLDKERIAIGRKPNNDIQIDNLAISGQHAVITTILGDAFLEDQNSTNGTYVNGQSVKKCVLHSNDVIELGKYRLKYIIETTRPGMAPGDYVRAAPEAVPDPDEAAQQTQVMPPEVMADVIAEPAFDDSLIGVIKVLSGPNAGRELKLVKALTTLGKPGHQVAVITRRQYGYVLSHAEGAVPPLVNGAPVATGGQSLNEGDALEIAGVRMAFSLRR